MIQSSSYQAWYNSVAMHALRSVFDFLPAKVSILKFHCLFTSLGFAISFPTDDAQPSRSFRYSINEHFVHQVS